MRKVNYTWQNLKTWLALVLLGVSAIGYSQATFTGANFNIPLAAGATSGAASGTVGVACVGTIANGANITLSVNLAHTFTGDLNMWLTAPSGQVLELSTRNGGGNNNLNVVFSDAGATNIASAVATTSTALNCPTTSWAYNGTFRPEGRNNVITAFNVVPSNVPAVGTFTFANTFSGVNADGNWRLTVDDGVGGDAGATCTWSISFAGVPAPAACTFVGGPVLPTLNLSTATDNCVGVPVAVPATQGSCAGAVIEASVDGGAFTPVVGPTIPGLAAGPHSIVWRVTNACLQVSTATQTVNVADLVPPVVTCPANITINLDAGECSAFVSYNVTATDNCPVFGPITTLNTITSGGNGGGVGGTVFFNLTNNTAGPLVITGFRMNISAATMVNVYTRPTTFVGATTNVGLWTFQGQANAMTGPFSGPFPGSGTLTNATLATSLTLLPGTTAIALQTPTASQNYTNGTGANQTYTDGNLTLFAGAASNGAFNGNFTPRVFNGSVNYRTEAATVPLVQTFGLPSGSEFFVGTTTNCFTATDGVGLQSSCCFDVIIREYANPSQQMACNDNVQISLDQNCEAVIGADDILEGGLYGCYDTRYTTMIVTPMGGIISGPSGEAIVNSLYIGGPHTVKVVDVVTGQSCWGTIMVKDKLPPVVVCRNITIPCTLDPEDPSILHPSPEIAATAPALNTINAGGNAGNVGGAVYFDIDNTTSNPITITELGMNISAGSIVNVFTKSGTSAGFEANAGAWTLAGTADATVGPFSGPFPGNGTITPAPTSIVIQPGITGFALVTPTAQHNYTNGNGANQTFTDGTITINLGTASNFPFTAPTFNPRVWNGSVAYEIFLPLVDPTDNCSGVSLTHVDSQTDGTCDAGTITRVWTATDDWGNTASCTQTIDIERPTLDDVLPPADVMWTCEQYDAFPNVTAATALHPYITDSNPATAVIEVNLDPNCDDLDLNLGTPATQDEPSINATNVANGGLGCPGSSPAFGNNGLDDADVLALTGSGLPTFDGYALNASCEITWDHDDLLINECAGTFKILRTWTLVDWCVNPYRVEEFVQVIKVVDNKAPVLELFAVQGETTSNYGTHDIPALGNGSNSNSPGGQGGGCNQEPQLSGGTSFRALVQLPQSLTPEQFTNVRLEKLWLEVDHARLSDLDIFLRSPDNRILQITANNGGNGSRIAADFYDAAPGNVNEAQFNVVGDFKPEGHNQVQYSYTNVFGQGNSPNYTAVWNVTYNNTPLVFNFNLTQANAMSQLANLMNANDPAAGIPPYVPNWTVAAPAGNSNLFFISGGYSGGGVQYGQLVITHTQTGTVTIINPTTHGASCGGFVGNISSFAQFDNPSLAFTSDVLGTWELLVFDEVSGATGKVVNWKLFFSTGPLTIDVYNASTPQNNGPHAVCQGTVVVPPVDGYDNCSGISSYKSELWTIVPGTNPAQPMALVASVNTNGGVFNNVPLFQNGANARYIVRHYAKDGCNNTSYIDRVIQLRDKVPPTPICVEYSEISITNNSNQTGGSCSRLYAEDLDLASYDNCKPVYFLMAKMNDATSTNIFNRCYYPYRDFCCEDIGNQQVILLVLDSEPVLTAQTPNAALGCDGTPALFLSQSAQFNTSGLNFSTCMVDVQVTDKIHPVLVSCPPSQRISCDWYADNLETQLASLTTPAERSALLTSLGFGAPTYYDNCAIDLQVTFTTSLDQCLEGTITRSWNNTRDGAGNQAIQPCTQTINVDHVSDFAVEFPADVTINCGTNPQPFGDPEIFYETCELVAVTSDDETYNVVADACYKIVRTWTVINWCVVGSEIDQEVVEQPENQLGLALPGCDIDQDGDCDARTFRDSWRGSAPVPNPFAPTAYRLRPFVNDAHTPNSNPVLNFRNPDTDVDTDPWDGYITYQQVIKVQDQVDPVFTNGCLVPDVCIEDNGCTATVLLPEPEITECSDHYTVTGHVLIGGVWVNGFSPILGVAPGTYQVRYVANDNCNNQTQCLSTVTVKDCKKPTPYCKNGVIIEIMQTGMVEVWASDLDAGSFDNCPPTQDPKLSFSANVNDISIVFTCDDLGTQEVELWVTDASNNKDFCTTFVVIQDNMGACDDDDPLVAGTIANEDDLAVEGVGVNVNSPQGFNGNAVTNAAGQYGVNVPSGSDVTVTPVLDENPLNGVSTFDLVLISKHILGVTPLGSPYKIIAADANRSNSVTTFDLVEIRKLILFINSDFPNNTSWRFVDAAHSFANPANPFAASFPEVINLNDVTVDQLDRDFVAVKVGDVNGSAAVSLLGSAEDRNKVGDLVLNADDMELEAGKEYTVDFKATDFNVSGYQFSMGFDAKSLEFVGIAAGLADASNFGTTMVKEGVLTASWNSDEAKALASGEVVFGVTFRALQGGRLSSLVSIGSSHTVAEAYNGSNGLMNVALSFNNNLVAGGFDLYQNTPNPFASVTTIGFYLPEATSATLTISDVQGKVVRVVEGDYSKGYNTVNLKRSDFGAAGVLYYRLDAGSDSATRKMILVD